MKTRDPALALLNLKERMSEDETLARPPDRRLVPGYGMANPGVMIVTGRPTASEDATGRLGGGQATQVLLSLMRDCAGLKAADWYLTTLVKYHNPAPTVRDVYLWTRYLREEWKILGCPKVIVAVGGVSWMGIGDGVQSIYAAAGSCFAKRQGRYVWAMLDPVYGLLHPEEQPRMEEHWESFGEWFADLQKEAS